jgi:hypothetical protein
MRPRTATSLAALALAAGIGLAGAAGAAPFFTLAGGVDGPDVGNDFAFINGTGAIIRESQVGNPATISITGPGNIRIEYIGKEALFSNNLFNWGALAGGLLVSDTRRRPSATRPASRRPRRPTGSRPWSCRWRPACCPSTS